MNCDWVKSNVTLYVYDELADDARYELEQHLDRCTVCAGEIKSALAFKAAMSALPQLEPTPNLLASCRMQLQERLEETEQARGWRRWVFDPMATLRRLNFSPALAAVLLMVGFGAGAGTAYKITSTNNAAGPIANAVQPNGQGELAEASVVGIRGISQDPSSNQVEIKYDTMVPQQVQGTLDDPRIQQLLLYAARTQNNTGVRMDSVDLLTRKPEDEGVREALMYALRYDNNPGVRLKAMEGLGPYVKDDIRIRNAVLEALVNDSNPGVRTGAINLLKPVRADGSVRQVLQHLATEDQNQNIRTLSRSVLASMPQIE
ncbi:MAG TPA: HEAT repeat domain-containing protein [Terriglobales bacterium]|nr:HEAT repeat domain-containing protein [Terriglobales bacterium]